MLKDARARRKFAKTRHPVEDGPACRIYGSVDVKKVTGNLHVVGFLHLMCLRIAETHADDAWTWLPELGAYRSCACVERMALKRTLADAMSLQS